MSSNVILKVENLSKQYRLGLVGTGTLSHDLNRWWSNILGKEDPYLKIGEVNNQSVKAKSNYVWALKAINFEVKQGEVLGIVGKNGAGKSTLLKILSRVTSPTTGVVKTKGRIASLLEVGTGFHPEMTGRENIYLNGAILGMTKSEITSKLDEIVDFSGCERYIDTPVKRYSSGMRVRLAFAVAAHLEPDILVVDEVLAVGDAEFQKKAIGKMQDISKGNGRTVLFVSHNMGAVKNLCSRSIVLSNGKLVYSGYVEDAISFYQSFNSVLKEYSVETSNKDYYLKSASINNASNNFENNASFTFNFTIGSNVQFSKSKFLLIRFLDQLEQVIFSNQIELKEGVKEYQLTVEKDTFTKGNYKLNIILYHPAVAQYDNVNDICNFTILNNNKQFYNLETFDIGKVYINQKWSY